MELKVAGVIAGVAGVLIAGIHSMELKASRCCMARGPLPANPFNGIERKRQQAMG